MRLIYDLRFTIYDLVSRLQISALRLYTLSFSVFALISLTSFTAPTYKMGKLKYSGGGDWYGNRTALPNLIDFCNKNLSTNFAADETVVEVGSAQLFSFPFVETISIIFLCNSLFCSIKL